MLGKLGLRQKTVFLKRKRVYTIPIITNKFFNVFKILCDIIKHFVFTLVMDFEK